jgi:hypothetical protein
MAAASKFEYECYEKFDYLALRKVVQNADSLGLDEATKEMLKTYLRKAIPFRNDSTMATFHVKYVYAHGATSGRRFAQKGLSLQSMFWRVRQTIAKDTYSDYDMVNAHPVILIQYCRKNSIACPSLDRYVQDREPLLKELCDANPGVDRDHAKKVVLAVMNGGTADLRALGAHPDWLIAFKEDVERVHQCMWNDSRNKGLVKAVTIKKGAEYSNLQGSLCNRILCDIESRLLDAAFDFARSKGVNVANAVLVFDGIMLPKGELPEDSLQEMADYMEDVTGYKVTIIEKPMNDPFDLTDLPFNEEREIQLVSDEYEAAKLLVDIVRPFVRKCGPRLFALTSRNTWTEDSATVNGVLLTLCGSSNIRLVDDEGRVKRFSGFGGSARNIISFTLPLLPDNPNFVNELWEASLGKVFFADGVYDFDKGMLREEMDGDMTTIRMTRPFPKVRDESKIAELRDRVFRTIFGCEEDIDCFLAHVARAMAGQVQDRHWVCCMSGRNSGKGVLCTLNENAWENYTTMVISESFLMDRSHGGDEAKKLSWLLNCEFARMIVTNEMRVDASDSKLAINGQILKGKMASGGDKCMARLNFKNEVYFRIQGRLFMWCNDLPPITPADAMDSMHKFYFPNEFVPELHPDPNDPSRRYQRLKDENIKRYCAEQDVLDAYTWMVIDAYRNHEVVPSQSVKEETASFVDASTDEMSVLKRVFQITERKDDFISSSNATDIVKKLKLNISPQKLKEVLCKLGAKHSTNVVIDGKRSRGFTGVRVTGDGDDE